VDVEVCKKRIAELDEEIERVRKDRETPVFVSEVALSAQVLSLLLVYSMLIALIT
jgi:hypothetical protein